jgi:hypothetical protein
MKNARHPIAALIGLNAALLLVLGLVVLTPSAGGQAGMTRARGTYTMVGGRIVGTPESAIYIVDAVNQELIATKWDRARKSLKGLGYQSLSARPRDVVAPADPGR